MSRFRRILVGLMLVPLFQVAGCGLAWANFPERVLTGTVFDTVQATAYQTFFNFGAGLGQ